MTERINARFNASLVKRFYQDGKVGAAAGWAVRAAADTWMSTLPASQTASTLIVPLVGLVEGDVIMGYHLLGQIDSAGNAASINCKLTEFVPAAAGSAATDLSGTTLGAVSTTADLLVNVDNTVKTLAIGDRIVVRTDRTYFAVVSGTTAATTDIEFLGLVLYVDPQR